MSRELLRQALEALTHIETCIHGHEEIRLGAINDLRAALAAPATAPAQPERKPMTDKDIVRIYGLSKSTTDFARNIELFIAEGTP